MYKLEELNKKKIVELQEIAKQLDIKKIKLNKEQLTYAILDKQAESMSKEKVKNNSAVKKKKTTI